MRQTRPDAVSWSDRTNPVAARALRTRIRMKVRWQVALGECAEDMSLYAYGAPPEHGNAEFLDSVA